MKYKTFRNIKQVVGELTEIIKENPVKKTVIGKDNEGNWRLGVMLDTKTALCFERNNNELAQATLDEFETDTTAAKDVVKQVLNFLYDVADIEGNKELMALHDDVEAQIKDCK